MFAWLIGSGYGRCNPLQEKLDRVTKKLAHYDAVNQELFDKANWLGLKLELAESQRQGITDDRDDLQVEHEALLNGYDKVREANTNLEKNCSALRNQADRLKGDLTCSANRSERYRKRCLLQETKLLCINDIIDEDMTS